MAALLRRRNTWCATSFILWLSASTAYCQLPAAYSTPTRTKPARAGEPGSWVSVGPQPTRAAFTGAAMAGRVSALAADPRNPDVVYAGAAQGGVWKTTDGGQTWRPLTDNQPSLAIGALALDPTNPDIVYAATGEGNFSPIVQYGAGLLKSTDGGATWRPLPGPFAGPFSATVGGAYIGSLAIHPRQTEVLLAAVRIHGTGASDGIYRSRDGGQTWTVVLNGPAGCEVVFDPADPQIAWAALGHPAGSPANGIYKSTDAGLTWAQVLARGNTALPAGEMGRLELALAPSAPATVYAGIMNAADRSLLAFVKTTDAGRTWTQLTATPNYCAPQCHYNHVIAVHPSNADVVYAGGAWGGGASVLFRSLDGGGTWQEISRGANLEFLHADSHSLAFTPEGSRLYAGNDGGVWSTTDTSGNPIRWHNLNATLAIAQFYSLSIHPEDLNITFGGTHDNGVQHYSGRLSWRETVCGDGGSVAIDFSNPRRVYAACERIGLWKSDDAGVTWLPSQSGIETSDRVQFIAPLAMDPANASVLYFGTYRIWRTTDRAASWQVISPDLAGGNESITAIAAGAGAIYSATSSGRVWVASGSTNWIERSGGLPRRPVMHISVDPANADIAMLSLGGFSGFDGDRVGHVFRSTDRGASWNDISGNLPNVPVHALVLDPELSQTIYAATDVGVFRTTDGGLMWTRLGEGLPRSAVRALALHRPSRVLRAATHGRGVWDLGVPLPGTPAPVINDGGVVNAAGFTAGAAVAPGSIAAVFGRNLALSTASAGSTPLPTSLAGSLIRFEGTHVVPKFYASPEQVNIQVPWELAGSSAGSVGASVAGQNSAAVTVRLAPFAPGIFAITPASAPRGSWITIWSTGLGGVTNQPLTGAAAPFTPLSETFLRPGVTIGGIEAEVNFSGLAPGFVGLYQVNARVPDTLPAGTVSVVIAIGGMVSNAVQIIVQ